MVADSKGGKKKNCANKSDGECLSVILSRRGSEQFILFSGWGFSETGQKYRTSCGYKIRNTLYSDTSYEVHDVVFWAIRHMYI